MPIYIVIARYFKSQSHSCPYGHKSVLVITVSCYVRRSVPVTSQPTTTSGRQAKSNTMHMLLGLFKGETETRENSKSQDQTPSQMQVTHKAKAAI